MMGLAHAQGYSEFALLLALGFNAMLRTSEMLSLSHQHVVPHRHGKGMSLIIPGSKTSQGNPQVLLVLDADLIAYASSLCRPGERSPGLALAQLRARAGAGEVPPPGRQRAGPPELWSWFKVGVELVIWVPVPVLAQNEVYTDWVESSEAIATGRQPPSAPVLMPPAVLLVTEVLYSWTPLESLNLGPDCTFQSWLVQIQEEGTGVWNSVESCLQQSASECLIQGLQCDTDYNVRVAAICQEPELVGEFRTSSFRTETGDVCLRPAATPSGLNATPGAPGSSLQLQWHPGAEPMDCSFFSWELNLRVQGAAEWQSQGCEGGGARENSSCTAGGLQSDTTYEIRIRENCSISSTNSDWSNVASASTHVLSAEVPGLNASVVSYDTVQLSWAQPLLNDCVFSRYQIQWSLQNGTWQDICQAELSSSCVLGCQVTGLPSRSLVRFRAQVLCVRTVANSGFAVAEVAMPDRLMGAPENVLVAASSSATEVFVSWSSGQLHDCDFQRWQLELYTDATGWQPSEACSFSSPSAQACQLSGLPCDTQFQLRLAGLCGESTGESGFASFATPDVPGCHAQALPPSWVVGSEATASSVSLTWSPGQEVENCSFLHWEVQVQPENQATYGPAAGCPEASLRNMSSCVVIGLQSATSHTFRVREVCQESTSSSDWAVTSVPISTLLVPAQAPSGLRASEATSSSVTIQWDVPQLNDCHFQGYVLRWRQREGGNWSSSTGCSFFSSSCESTCTANGLPSNAQIDVEVRVSCTQAEAESDWTSASFQTLPVPAGAVVQLSLSEIFTGGGTLSWTPPALNDCALAAYTVELREVFGTWALPSGSCGPSTTPPCSLQGLNCDSNYEVRVAANCTNPLASGPFATVSFTTDVGELCLKQAPAPRSVMATALGVSSLAVAWVDASANASRNCSFSEWQVELRPSSSEGWSSACRVLELQVTDCVASGLPSNTAHHFRVREVCDDVGTWGYTAAAVSTAPVAAAPMVVQASSPQVSQMLVQWSSPELNDCLFSRFKLQWSVDSSSWQEVACGASNFCDSSCSAQSLPSNTAVTFRGRTICTEEALNGEWSNSSVPVSTLPRPSEPLVVHVNVWSYDAAELSWSRPVLNDCILQGWQVELLDSNLWTSGPGCQGLTADATGCNLTNLACDSDFQARVSTRCHSALADAEPRSVSFRTAAGAECLKRAGAPLGVLLLATSVSSATLTWEAGSPNDCTFASWAVQLSPTEPGPSFSCASSLRDSTSCIFSGLAENSSYVASIQELCAESSLASPSALSQVATTFSVPWPSVALQLPFPDETVERRPEELMVMYDVDVELPVVGSVKSLVAKLVDLSCRHCIRKCKESCKHDRAIICKGRKGFGLGLFVFTYDQRIPTSLWDHHTVLRRGLTVLVPLPEPFRDREDGSPLELSVLEEATQNDSPLEVAECMPKFFEADESTLKGLQSFSTEDLQLEAILEKVDGSLGLLHPPRDPATLEVIDGLPLLSSKSVGYSSDIAQVRVMLEEQHPNLRLPEGVTSLIVEVVRPEVQVCVPYSYQGFRLLAVMKEGAWLWEDAADAMAQELGMERPKRLSFEHVKPRGYGAGEAPSLSDVMAKAQAYVMGEDPHTLEEGWVVVFRNGLRLKVHTEVWNMVHAWWSNRINTKTVLPLLEDPRINQVPFSSLRECLCGPAATEKRRQNADALEALLRKLKPIYEECQVELRNVVKETAKKSLKELKVNGHPLVKIIQMVRGRQGWVESIPEEVDLETLLLSNEAVRHMFLPRAARAERELETTLDAAVLQGIETKLLRAVQMCLEVLPKNTTVPALEKDLQKPLPEEMVPLISGKGLILPDAFQRLTAVLARRTVAPEASRCKSDE
ncbi:unnamed protein product [Durusdinium trenchii]|uniref:Fibronectin type-III domain-containing protein n=1 Tax=Durusdinium trenchii TaxID=1381693 RepID=A0ABP0LF24_9DINO